MKVGDKAPDFCLEDHNGRRFCLSDFKGKWVILYFYKSHFGLRCTKVTVDFNSRLNELKALNAVVIGIAPNDKTLAKEYVNFFEIKIIILSDPELTVIRKYGVEKDDPEELVQRSTFLIDPDGFIKKIWFYEDVEGHVDEVIKELKKLQGK